MTDPVTIRFSAPERDRLAGFAGKIALAAEPEGRLGRLGGCSTG